MPQSSNIFINFGNNTQFSNFHENKIIQLEKFLKDLSKINMINTSKPYRKFLEFEQYVDEDNEVLVSVGQSNIRGNYNNFGNIENIENKSLNGSLNDD